MDDTQATRRLAAALIFAGALCAMGFVMWCASCMETSDRAKAQERMETERHDRENQHARS